MSQFTHRRAALFAAASSFVLAMASPAVAQDDAEERDVITVYGQALSIERAIEAKRSSNSIIEALVQDDIGRLPDLNTAQALVRLPGLAVQNDQSEARFAVVRGLNATYNRTTIDGGIVASPERGSLGRAVPLDLIPAALLARIEVQKTITPDLDHNAIGGTINLITRSAFDQESPFVLGSVFLGVHENSGKGTSLDGDDRVTPWRGNFAAGTTFGSNDEFGVVIGVDYSIRNFEVPQVEVDDADYTEFDAAGNNVGLGKGNGIVAPTNNRLFFYNNVRERLGLTGKLEWQPNETLGFELSGSYNEYNDDERRDEFTYELGTSGASSQPATIHDQTATTGVTDTGYGFVGIGRFVLDREIISMHAGANWSPTDALLLEFNATLSTAELNNPEVTEGFRTANTFGAAYDTSTIFNRVSPLDPVGYFNPASYAHVNRGVLARVAEDDLAEYKFDATWTVDGIDGLELQAGALYRDSDKFEAYEFERFVTGTGTTYTLANAADATLADVQWQGGHAMPTRVDLVGSDAFFDANAFDTALTANGGSSAQEQITAGYAMGTLQRGPWTLIGGVRIEQTEWEGAPRNGARISGDYTDVLPSFNLRYELTDDVVLRAAASKTLGRPNLNMLTRGLSINMTGNSISRSNPDLAPRESSNFDISAEWYIPDGILAAGVFYKDIQDEIFVLTTYGAVTVDGVSYGEINQPENASNAKIRGLELQYQQTLGFLPAPFDGFGVSANATFLDTEFVVPTNTGTRETGFFQQPDVTYNFTGYYATEAFELRISYNYTDQFLDSLNANNPNLDEYWEERSQVDLQARINLNDRFTLIGEVANLTDQGRRELTGPGAAYLQEDAEFGRTFWLGVTAHY